MSNAAAVRRCKLRKKAGIGILQVELPLGPLADQLVDDKFLAEWDTEDQAEIQKAFQQMALNYISLKGNRLAGSEDR